MIWSVWRLNMFNFGPQIWVFGDPHTDWDFGFPSTICTMVKNVNYGFTGLCKLCLPLYGVYRGQNTHYLRFTNNLQMSIDHLRTSPSPVQFLRDQTFIPDLQTDITPSKKLEEKINFFPLLAWCIWRFWSYWGLSYRGWFPPVLVFLYLIFFLMH